MPNAQKARKGYWRFDPFARVTAVQEDYIVNTRACPLCVNGTTQRVAERELAYPYHWRAIGYRCNTCGTFYIDVEKKV